MDESLKERVGTCFKQIQSFDDNDDDDNDDDEEEDERQ